MIDQPRTDPCSDPGEHGRQQKDHERTDEDSRADNRHLLFASVEKDGIEVMYQTRASVLADSPASASDLVGHSTVLFITVPDLDSVERAVAGAPIVKPRHKTFYGSVELYVREPGGNTVGFAQFSPVTGA